MTSGSQIAPLGPATGNHPSSLSAAQRLGQAGIQWLEAGEYEKASTAFNAALKLDITNASLQFLNGMAYHLRALQGDTSLYPLARQAYLLARKFDPSQWLATYHLGLLAFERRDFAEAQERFAEAVLYQRDDPEILYALAAASYYAHDPTTAAGALARLRAIHGETPQILQASALVMAALGEFDKARAFLDRYAASGADQDTVRRLARRIDDWRYVHRSGQNQGKKAATRIRWGYEEEEGERYAEPSDEGEERARETRTGGDGWGTDDGQNGEEQETEPDPYKMVIVDVVIIRTEEDMTTARGINLLNGLKLQFGQDANNTAAFSWQRTFDDGRETTETASDPTATGSVDTTLTDNWSRALVSALNVPAITYSLNIANSNNVRNEILARPTLVATANETSTFFSGVEIDAAAIGGAASNGSTVEIQKEIGVKLELTPEFLDDGRIKLRVLAERTFLTTPNTTSVTFSLRVDTSKTNVEANVVMRFGETLILSGLSEKETERTRDGVPLLQDIPGVQYLFSHKTTRDFHKSVLILITPRPANYVYQDKAGRAASRQRQSGRERALSELQARYSDWFKPYPNWASIFHHMQGNSLYREFRTGDVTLEKWSSQTSLRARLRQLRTFLYY